MAELLALLIVEPSARCELAKKIAPGGQSRTDARPGAYEDDEATLASQPGDAQSLVFVFSRQLAPQDLVVQERASLLRRRVRHRLVEHEGDIDVGAASGLDDRRHKVP
jgi:hypothetical protein